MECCLLIEEGEKICVFYYICKKQSWKDKAKTNLRTGCLQVEGEDKRKQ